MREREKERERERERERDKGRERQIGRSVDKWQKEVDSMPPISMIVCLVAGAKHFFTLRLMCEGGIL